MMIMKSAIGMFMIFMVGCSSTTTPYLTARYHDALDIFTFTTGYGGGIKMVIGPLNVGQVIGGEQYGIRGGLPASRWSQRGAINDVDILPLPLPAIPPLWLEKPPNALWTGLSAMPCRTCLNNRAIASYCFPFIAIPRPSLYGRLARGKEGYSMGDKGIPRRERLEGEHAWQYLTQCDFVAGIGGTMRVGANPGELLDFILGWTTLDFYGDDPYPNGFDQQIAKRK